MYEVNRIGLTLQLVQTRHQSKSVYQGCSKALGNICLPLFYDLLCCLHNSSL